MHAIGLRLGFFLGALVASVFVAVPVLLAGVFRGRRVFHPRGTVCRAELVPLDDGAPDVGRRLAGPATVRLSGAFEDENSPDADILGMAIRIDGVQDLPIATFESFRKGRDGLRNTDVADYLGNQYASVTPWRSAGLSVVWFRAVPCREATEALAAISGTRVERLDAHIAADRARFTLEARTAPGPDGPRRARLAELRLVERLPDDDRRFRTSMFRTGRGLVPTGFRNGLRAITYPVGQLARRIRGG
jgi:hypothetical protein